MILKEFDLDAPELEKEKRNLFRLQTRCMTALFEKYFDKFLTDSIWKILVEGVSEVKKNKARNLLGVLAIEIKCDFQKFFAASDREKKEMAIQLLREGINIILTEYGWNIEPFQRACQKIIDADFKNEWVWKKPKSNPSRQLKAEVFCRHDVNEFNLYVRVFDKNGKMVKNELIVKDIPDEFIFAEYFGKLKWLRENSVQYESKDGEKSWIIEVKGE